MADQTNSLPAGPQSWQLLLQVPAILASPAEYLAASARKYGDFVRFQAGPQTAVLINHPDGIQHILQNNQRNYTKDTMQYNALSTVTGHGLLTSDGPEWLRVRRLAQPAFSRARLAGLGALVQKAVQPMLDGWEAAARAGLPVEVDDEMLRVTLEIVGRALFGIDLRQDAPALTSAVITALDHIVHKARQGISLPDSFPTPGNLRFQRALRTLDQAVYAILNARRAQPTPQGEQGQDLLNMLLQARDESTGRALSDAELRNELITLLIAGHETVASALTWTWYLLARSPAARIQMEDELRSVLNGRAPEYEDLPALAYTRQVFDEALRLYPPAWLITRQAIAADEVLGQAVPPRALVILSPYAIHRHPAFWENPESFEPQRFSAAGQAARPRYAYIPFGGGPRLGIGSGFAQVEAALILAAAASRFRLDLSPGQEVRMDALVTLRPHGGLPMRVTLR